VPGKIHLNPAATALNLDPNAIVLTGDNGRRVNVKREILHDLTPSLVEVRLYPVGVSKRVRTLNEPDLKLSGCGSTKVRASELLEQRNGCVRSEGDFLDCSAHIKADTHHVILIGDDRGRRHEFASHIIKLLGLLASYSLCPTGNARADDLGAQLKVCIFSFLRNAAFKVAGLQLHLVSHLDELGSVHAQACRSLDTFVSLRAALPRRHLNHSHKSASYSHADITGLVGGVIPEPSWNFRRTS
jgi:hypothetical protein